MQNKKYLSALLATGMIASLAVTLPAFAQENSQQDAQGGQGIGQMMGKGGWGGHMRMPPGVFGTVSAINGTTITITSAMGPNGTAGATYTIDASSATVDKNGAASSVGSIAVGDKITAQGTINGNSVAATAIHDGMPAGGMRGRGPGVFGTVASISGTTLTLTGKTGPQGGTATTYTVDASSATVTKSGTASSVSSIAVGDTVMIQGTISGNSVTAKTIRDGVPAKGQGNEQDQNPLIAGNGQPIVAGSVTAISGSTLTVTNKSNVTYTIDASVAKIQKGNALSTVGSIAVGDSVVVQGTVNGNSVTAASVIDSPVAQTAGTTTPAGQPQHLGFFGSIGHFFSHLFGF